jgi:hypothetical protein
MGENGLGALQGAVGALIVIAVMFVIGAVILDNMESAHLISTTGSLNGTMGQVTSAYGLIGTMLVLIVVVVVAVIVLRQVKGMNKGN